MYFAGPLMAAILCIGSKLYSYSLVFDTPVIQILTHYLDFEDTKNIHVLKVLIWGFGGRWGFLPGVWHLDLDLDMVTGL